MPRTCASTASICRALSSSTLSDGPHDLDRVLALDARERFLDVVLDVLGEVEVDPRKLAGEPLRQDLRQPVLVEPVLPGVEGLQGHEELDVVRPADVGSVVGPPDLGHDGLDLGTLAKDVPHAPDVLRRLRQRDGQGQGRADPEVPFLELRHELAADEREQGEEEEDRDQAERRGELRPGKRALGRRDVEVMEPAQQGVVALLDAGRQAARERGGQRQREDEGSGDGVRVGVRHRREDHARDAREREERQERDAQDDRREDDRAPDLARGGEDPFLARAPERRGRGAGRTPRS